MKKIRLALVNPRTPPSFWGMDHSLAIPGLQAVNIPLGLCTIAALSPEHWDITILDENIEQIDFDFACDIVGIGAMNNQAPRTHELAAEFRRRGRTVVIGGPMAFSDPEDCGRHADVVVVGEAERTWPAFCRDYEQGSFAPQYLETAKIDLALSPVPRFDLLQAEKYATIGIQTTRGCPHDCEFCDIVVMMGRRVRTKPIENVLAEIDAVREHFEHDSIFFTDDNFNGNLKYTRALLRAVIEHRERTGYKPVLMSQTSVNLAEQDDILELLVKAGFTRVFLGVETPRQQSLREAGKRQNVRGDLVERIHKIQAAGLITWAGMIVGFDHDDVDIFAEQAEFLDKAGIAMAMVGLLNAIPKTPLHKRLADEGRLLSNDSAGDNCGQSNVIPKNMSREQLLRGYADLMTHLYKQDNYARRLRSNIFRMGKADSGSSSAARLPNRAELRAFFVAIKTFTWSRRADYRRHFLPNFLAVALRRFDRAVEACIHLGMWLHFDHYVPEIVAGLERAALEAAQEERAQLEASPAEASAAPPQGAAMAEAAAR